MPPALPTSAEPTKVRKDTAGSSTVVVAALCAGFVAVAVCVGLVFFARRRGLFNGRNGQIQKSDSPLAEDVVWNATAEPSPSNEAVADFQV